LVNGAEVATARSIAAPAAAGPSPSEQLAATQIVAEPSANTAIRPVSSVQAAGKPPRVNALAGVEAIDVMRQLRQDDRQAAAEARAELVRRGFGEVDLELARQLFDPDPAVRKRVARAVPRLESVDAVPWLLWLCHDEDADVRMTAVTLLATTGDPRILEQVEALARQDTDPRIHELAEQIGQQREMAGSRGGGSGEQSHPNFTRVSGQR
jgi:HEAT repeat protein